MTRGYITSGRPSEQGGAPALDRPYSINDPGIVAYARESRPITFTTPKPSSLGAQARPVRIPDCEPRFVPIKARPSHRLPE